MRDLVLECARKQQQTGAFDCFRWICMQNTLFGLTEAELTELGMTFGIGGLMLMMVFIVGHLAWESKAGRFGTFVLFLGLALGLVGFAAKYIIKSTLGLE